MKALSIAVAVASAALLGTTQAATATNLSHVKTVTNTDWTSAGVGGMRDYGYGTLTVSGVTGPVTSAILYSPAVKYGAGAVLRLALSAPSPV